MKPHRLRIITGRLKNRGIAAPPGTDTRPSLEKTRGIIFDTLASRIDLGQFQAIDLFAGSGALGIEAYSRGTEPVYFLERGAAYKTLTKNVLTLLPPDSFFLFHQDGLAWLRKTQFSGRPCLFLLDPPYQFGMGQKALDLIAQKTDQLPGTWVVLEADRLDTPNLDSRLTLVTTKYIGRSRLDFIEILQ